MQDLEELFRQHEDHIRAVCRSILADPAEAEDAVQETFIALDRFRDSIRSPDAVGAWLQTTARRKALGQRRSRLRRQRRHRQFATEQAHAQTGPQSTTGSERVDTVRTVMDTLPPHYHQALTLRYVDRHSHPEAAAIMDISPNSFRGILQRAKSQLKQALYRRGIHGRLSVLLGLACLPHPQLSAQAATDAGFFIDSAQFIIGAAASLLMCTGLSMHLFTPETVAGVQAPAHELHIQSSTPAQPDLETVEEQPATNAAGHTNNNDEPALQETKPADTEFQALLSGDQAPAYWGIWN